MKTRYLFGLFILLGSVSADAFAEKGGDTSLNFSFTPENPATSEFVRMRLDVVGCFSASIQDPTVTQASIEVRLYPDVLCDAGDPSNTETPRFANVGYLAAGYYATSIVFCVSAPPPEGPFLCSAFQEGQLLVRSAAGASVIPSTSPTGLFALVAVLALWGVQSLRRR